MAQHFLLSTASRTLKLKDIYKAGEDAAYAKFCEIRWPETDGEAVCPRCGCCDTYNISTRHKFKCKACSHQFSVTSGTTFASRKMDFTDLLAAICIIANASVFGEEFAKQTTNSIRRRYQANQTPWRFASWVTRIE